MPQIVNTTAAIGCPSIKIMLTGDQNFKCQLLNGSPFHQAESLTIKGQTAEEVKEACNRLIEQLQGAIKGI